MFGDPAKNGAWYALGDEWYIRAHDCDFPVPVTVTEDPEGDHLGWIDAEDERAGDYTPEMIRHRRIFEMQFIYGSKVEVEAGNGRVVPLRVELA
jgi:hypothetical protein